MPVRRSKSRKSVRRSKSRKSVRLSKRKSVRRSKRKSVRRSKRKSVRRSRKSVKKSSFRPTNCKVARSRTNKKSDLIKEIRSYVKCHERKTQINQDLPMSRLNSESVPQLKRHLSFYRKYNKN
jgi:hypothetical protein